MASNGFKVAQPALAGACGAFAMRPERKRAEVPRAETQKA